MKIDMHGVEPGSGFDFADRRPDKRGLRENISGVRRAERRRVLGRCCAREQTDVLWMAVKCQADETVVFSW